MEGQPSSSLGVAGRGNQCQGKFQQNSKGGIIQNTVEQWEREWEFVTRNRAGVHFNAAVNTRKSELAVFRVRVSVVPSPTPFNIENIFPAEEK